MPANKNSSEVVNWSLTTWEGCRRETLRRWAELRLERVIAALEEMQQLSDILAQSPAANPHEPPETVKITGLGGVPKWP